MSFSTKQDLYFKAVPPKKVSETTLKFLTPPAQRLFFFFSLPLTVLSLKNGLTNLDYF